MKTWIGFFISAVFAWNALATDMNDVIRLCEGAMQHPENELMYKACSGILQNIEENKTKNQFSCECKWTTQMTPVSNGKLCEYRCSCECDENKKQTYISSITALSQKVEPAGDTLAYDCEGQALWGLDSSTPDWKKTLIGEAFKIDTKPTTIKSDLVKKIDEVIQCN